MGEVMRLFGKLGDRNDLIKVLSRFNYKVAAQKVADMDDIEYQKLVPKLNSVLGADNLRFASTIQSVNEAISTLAKEHGKLAVVLALLQIADGYAGTLKGGMQGLSGATTNTDVVYKLRETEKLKVVAEYLEAYDGNDNKTRQ